MGKYRAYSEYKDSGVEWLGEVPSHWTRVRVKNIAALNPSKSAVRRLLPDTGVSFLPMQAIGERGELALTQSKPLGTVLDGYTYVGEGDVIIAKITPCFENGKGAVATSLKNGVAFATTEVIPLRCHNNRDRQFLYYLLSSSPFRPLAEGSMYGAGGQKRVSDNFVANYSFALPSEDERVQIATFLDRETAKIDRLIAKQEALIDLLKEKRQAVISHAVTKGLDPDAPMKDSGVEWLGEIPAHWGVAPFYAFFEVQLGKMLDSRRITGEHLFPYLRNTDVQWDQINTDDLPMMDFSDEDQIKYELRKGDLIVCEGGEIGRCAIWNGEEKDCFYQKALHRIRPLHDDSIWIRFTFYFLRFMAKNEIFSASANQPTIAHLTAEQIRCVRVPAIPLDEQKQIAKFLDVETRKIDETVDTCLKAVELLQERRTALISAAVTGKIDVREEM